jgi:hypothetical protein
MPSFNYRNESSKLRELADYLTNRALAVGHLSCSPQAVRIKRMLKEGKEIPDEMLPGRELIRALKNIPEDVRGLVHKLKAKHFNHLRIAKLLDFRL